MVKCCGLHFLKMGEINRIKPDLPLKLTNCFSLYSLGVKQLLYLQYMYFKEFDCRLAVVISKSVWQ